MSWPKYEPYVRATALSGLDKSLENHEIKLKSTLEEVGINPESLTDSSMLISIVAYNRLLNLFAERTSRDNFGFELVLSNRDVLNNVGPLALILKLGDTTGECVENGLKFVKYHTNGIYVELFKQARPGQAEFRYSTLPPLSNVRHLVEHALGIACAGLRFLVSDKSSNPKKVTFQHSKPIDPLPLEEYFQCPLEFGAATNSLFFDSSLLELPTAGSDSQLSEIIFSYLNAEIEKVESELSMASSVAAVVGQLLPSGRCTIDLVAKGLALHPKTLQRRLYEEGTSYSEILDGIRKATATRLLTETSLPSSKIAILCGYSSPGAFNFAFKDWEKKTPGQFRSATK